MHILILQHARVETAGSLGRFLKEDGHTSQIVHLDANNRMFKDKMRRYDNLTAVRSQIVEPRGRKPCLRDHVPRLPGQPSLQLVLCEL